MTNSGRMPRRILHTSDLHLEKLNDRAWHSFEALITLARQDKMDMIAIAGDFFDSNRVSDEVVSLVVERLQSLEAYTIIAPGNHDCLVPDSVYDRTVYNRMELWKEATKIRIFREPEGETLNLPGLGISVWGKPITSYDGDGRPMEGLPRPQGNGVWHIAVIHGYYMHSMARQWASFHITQEEIDASGQDYIALGDTHGYVCISEGPVRACYCGSPPLSGTVALVDLSEEGGVQVTPYALTIVS